MKRVALLGGSFNPPHPGHFDMARIVHQTTGADEIWLLFSLNTEKDPADYAPLAHRMEMARLLASHYKDVPIVLSTFQEDMGVHITSDVLKAARDNHPDTEFIWVMGTDNLIGFHTWEEYDDILHSFPCLILRREPYTSDAMLSVTATKFPELRQPDAETLMKEGKGWLVLTNDPVNISSSGFLRDLRAGKRQFDGLLQEIADYSLAHGLYGMPPKTA